MSLFSRRGASTYSMPGLNYKDLDGINRGGNKKDNDQFKGHCYGITVWRN
jgi:hypothetical protein